MNNEEVIFKRKEHIPFTRYPIRMKEMDGVYRSKEDSHIHLIKNVNLVGMVDGESNEAYASYRCTIKSTNPQIGYLKSCLIDDLESWERVLDIYGK